MARSLLVTDFDGTITERDFYALVLEECMPPGAPDYWAQYGRGEITHFQAMRAIFSHAPAEALDRLIAALNPDPRLDEAFERLRRCAWEVAIVSAGSTWYIDRVLAAAGVRAKVHANPGHVEQGRGLVLELPHSSPFFSPETGIDKAAVVREAFGKYERVAFAGDGPPDVAAALLVAPECRFARGWLARDLARRKVPFRPFHRWWEIAERLCYFTPSKR